MYSHCDNIGFGCAASLESSESAVARRSAAIDKVCEAKAIQRLQIPTILTRHCERRISEKYDKVFVAGCLEPEVDAPRANAAFVVLARDQELEGVIQSVKSIERHFNRWFHYPYVFLNDGDFSHYFKETIKNYTSAPVEFGKIDPSMWGYPEWTNADVAREGIRKQGDAAIMYGGMESYHHMCRFYSGYAQRIVRGNNC